ARSTACPDLPSLPGVSDADRTLQTWLDRAPAAERVILSAAEISDLNRARGAEGAGTRDLTRAAWLEEAFQPLRSRGDPVPPLLAWFGVADAGGSCRIDLGEVESPRERGLLIAAAAERGAVLLEDGAGTMIHLGDRRVIRYLDTGDRRCGAGEVVVAPV